MSSTLLEVTRGAHEDVERLERLINEMYEDNDNARKDEIAALGGQTATGTNVFSAFYDRLKEKKISFLFIKIWPWTPELLFLHNPEGMVKSMKPMDDTWIYMNYTISISILNLESPLSRLLTLMFFHYHISLQGSAGNILRILFSIWLKLDLKNNGQMALALMGLKVGGTIQQRAERLLLTKNSGQHLQLEICELA
ncbi:hypothetical protein ACLB2K_037879 [Fragaria x ananassa]